MAILHDLLIFSKLFFKKTIRLQTVSIGSDLGPNCLQKLSADDSSR